MPLRYSHLALLAAFSLPLSAAAQHKISAVGLQVNTGLLLPHLRSADVYVEQYHLLNEKAEDAFGSRLYQGGIYARFEDAEKWWVLQPELQYYYGRNSYVRIDYPLTNGSSYSSEDYDRTVRRAELALLGGARLAKGGYLLLGPVLAANMRGPAQTANLPGNQPILDALVASAHKTQVLGRVGLYSSLGRFEYHLNYELGLTPYAKELSYQGKTYAFGVNNHSLTLGFGVKLYQRD